MARKPQNPELHKLFLTSAPITQILLKLTGDRKQWIEGTSPPNIYCLYQSHSTLVLILIESHFREKIYTRDIFLIQQIHIEWFLGIKYGINKHCGI